MATDCVEAIYSKWHPCNPLSMLNSIVEAAPRLSAKMMGQFHLLNLRAEVNIDLLQESMARSRVV
jgi:hypothetical protein